MPPAELRRSRRRWIAYAAFMIALFMATGLFVIGSAVEEARELSRLQAHGAPLDARIDSWRRMPGPKGLDSYAATVRFRPPGGAERRWEIDVPRDQADVLADGREIRIRYVPDAPPIIRLEPFDASAAWRTVGLTLVAGLLLAGAFPAYGLVLVSRLGGPRAAWSALRALLAASVT